MSVIRCLGSGKFPYFALHFLNDIVSCVVSKCSSCAGATSLAENNVVAEKQVGCWEI